MKVSFATQPAIFAVALLLAGAFSMRAQTQTPASAPKSQPPAAKPAQQQSKTPVGPTVPQSRHYPILLIAQGSEPSWSLRLGMKGPERLERTGYPPIPLEPAEVGTETAGSAWTYHAKDSQTQAAVAVHLSREVCTDGMSDTKYTFRVALDHAQIGTLKGCAKVAPDQFPEFKQKNLDDDDPDKKKPVTPTIAFKAPVAVAYLDPAGKVMLARNDVPKLVVPKGSQLSLSHDGKRLLFLREENGPEVSLQIFDSGTGKFSELAHGLLKQPFWSPDDSRIAFLKSDSSVWHIWILPANATSASQPTQLSPTPVNSLDGWSDAHTVIGANASTFFWISDDGGTAQTISALDLNGPDFQSNADAAVRVSPVNSDLLLISGSLLKTPPASPKDPKTNLGADLFLYEVRSKRRTPLGISNLLPSEAEWSRDGVQIFFTSRDSSGKPSIYRVFWDGSGLKKIRLGSGLVVGQ